VLGKPFSCFLRAIGYSLEMISHTDNPAYKDSIVSEYNYGRVIPVSVDDNLCKYCRKLTKDILGDPVAPAVGWETVHSKSSLIYLKEHHDGTRRSLLQSAKDGCDLCELLAKHFSDMNENLDIGLEYHIFNWVEVPKKCEFLLGLGSLSRWLKDISERDKFPIVFRFFRRNGSDTNWSNLDSQINFRDGIWPPLLTWPNQFPDSDEAIHRAQRWLLECTEIHMKCSRSPTVLPKRVLDLGPSESHEMIVLYVTNGEVAPYVTLSYAWGKSPALKTTTDNLHEHCAGIPFTAFPKTLRDAISLTKRLGFKYLWIDALCIIQEGHLGDWREQAALMAEIYTGSAFTISALSSSDCESGLFRKLPDHGIRIGTYSYPDGNIGDIFAGRKAKILDLEAKALSRRGWTFQERLVSIASLHYTDEGMVWECASGMFPEHDYERRGFEWKSDWKRLVGIRSQNQAVQISRDRGMSTQKDHYDL
jgi:hypothetical protein